jgi:hypothetical protein
LTQERVTLTPEQAEIFLRMQQEMEREVHAVEERHAARFHLAAEITVAGHGIASGRMDLPQKEEDGTWVIVVERD